MFSQIELPICKDQAPKSTRKKMLLDCLRTQRRMRDILKRDRLNSGLDQQIWEGRVTGSKKGTGSKNNGFILCFALNCFALVFGKKKKMYWT